MIDQVVGAFALSMAMILSFQLAAKATSLRAYFGAYNSSLQ